MNTKMNKATSEKLALTTFCANVLILLHHANLSEYVESIGVAQCVMNFFSAIAQPGMTWFFLVSAYLFFRKIEAKDFKRKFQSRIRSLLIPYLLWNTIAVLLKIALGTRFDNIWTFFRSTYLFYGNTGVANGPLWYLFRLMEFVVLAPIIYIVVKRKKIKTTIGVCILLSAFNIVFEISYFGFTYFLPVYIIGAFVGVNYADKVEQFCAKKVSPHYSDYYLGLTLLVLLLLGLFSQNIVVYGLRLISRYAVVILAPMLIRLLPEENRQSRFISGGGGMWIYCAHYIIYAAVRSLLLKTDFPVLAMWLALIIVSFIIMYLFWAVLHRICNPLLSVLVGGRT